MNPGTPSLLHDLPPMLLMMSIIDPIDHNSVQVPDKRRLMVNALTYTEYAIVNMAVFEAARLTLNSDN